MNHKFLLLMIIFSCYSVTSDTFDSLTARFKDYCDKFPRAIQDDQTLLLLKECLDLFKNLQKDHQRLKEENSLLRRNSGLDAVNDTLTKKGLK